ncbi:unnamed protein product [Prunus armeniaca]
MSVLDWTVNNFNLLSFTCKSIPKFNFGRALIYFKLWEAFERVELQLLQSEGAEVAGLEDLMSWNCTVKFVEVFIFVKTQTLLVLAFA